MRSAAGSRSGSEAPKVDGIAKRRYWDRGAAAKLRRLMGLRSVVKDTTNDNGKEEKDPSGLRCRSAIQRRLRNPLRDGQVPVPYGAIGWLVRTAEEGMIRTETATTKRKKTLRGFAAAPRSHGKGASQSA